MREIYSPDTKTAALNSSRAKGGAAGMRAWMLWPFARTGHTDVIIVPALVGGKAQPRGGRAEF